MFIAGSVFSALGPATGSARQPDGPYVGSPYHGAFASAPDVLRFANVLHGNTLLTPAFTRVVTDGKYAMGGSWWSCGRRPGHACSSISRSMPSRILVRPNSTSGPSGLSAYTPSVSMVAISG